MIVEPALVISAGFSDVIHPGKHYPTELEPQLAPWYVYTIDGGHSLIVAVRSLYRRGAHPDEFLCPCPVKTVQRLGWLLTEEGFLIVDATYYLTLGVVAPDEDTEH